MYITLKSVEQYGNLRCLTSEATEGLSFKAQRLELMTCR